jgi:signal transduction histidine kinase
MTAPIFKRIGRSIALQFTAFVVLILLIAGAIFLITDFRQTRRQTDSRLLGQAQRVVSMLAPLPFDQWAPLLSPRDRDRTRIIDDSGRVSYQGGIFSSIPFEMNKNEFENVSIQGEPFRLLTLSVIQNGQVQGFVQFVDRPPPGALDLEDRAVRFILVSALISVATFAVGLFFARRSLRPAEEMFERLEQFTQDASHELRTPLAVLGSSLDVALKTENYREGLLSAKDDLKQVAALVERLLELARLDKFAIDPKPVDLSALVEEIMKKFEPLAAEHGVAIAGEIAPGVHTQGDAALVRQLIGNLLSNAIKYNKKNGAVRLTLTDRMLSVEDTGIGIAAQDLPHVFNRFFQADDSRARGGVGLGLALVKRIADLHGWQVSAKSKEGDGSTFTVTFTHGRTHGKKKK